jgi:MFS family permease
LYSESDLEAAVTAGALTPQQATAFRDHVASSRHAPMVDEEHFRLLTGFNDIFVAIAAVILLVAVAWIGHYVGPRIEGEGPSPVSGLLVAGTAWSLAEFFTRQRRMALPSILLLLAFVGGVFAFSTFVMVLGIGPDRFEDNQQLTTLTLAGAAAIAAGAAWLHWRRFRVPITVAAGVAALAALILFLIAFAIGDVPALEDIILIVALVLGVGVFLLAMRWDSSDPKRETRRSDVAFWLHLLAAPMIVHPVFTLLGLTEGTASPAEAAIVVALYVVLGMAALAIDRRALLVSALAYVLYALDSLFREYGAVELSVALTALIIGSALLLLSAFWTNARRAVVKPLPDGLRARLPMIDRVGAPAVAA